MATNASFLSSAHLGLHTFEDGVAWVYVTVDQREAFDSLPGKPGDNQADVGATSPRRVLTKEVRQEPALVTFLHWPNSSMRGGF